MKNNKMLTYLIAVLALSIIVSFGCGGGASKVDDSYYFGPVTRVTITGASASGLTYFDASGNLLFDQSGGSIAEGGSGDGISSGSDIANASCAFSTAADGLSVNDDIQVVNDIGDCISLNKCIICTLSQSSPDCSISCDGYVPSNEASNSDSVDITITWTHEFYTNMSAPGPILRFDGQEISDDLWPEFEPDDATLGIQYDFTGCNGTDFEMTLDTVLTNNDISEYHYEYWGQSFDILTVNPDTGGDGLSDCIIEQTMTARMPLTGASTVGNSLDIARGSVFLHGQICADPVNCPAPQVPLNAGGSELSRIGGEGFISDCTTLSSDPECSAYSNCHWTPSTPECIARPQCFAETTQLACESVQGCVWNVDTCELD